MRAIRQLALISVCFSALGVPAFAQDTPETVTVTATRNPTSALDYPGMVDVLGPDQLAASIPSTISDLVDDMPNVQFSGGPRRTGETPVIRGLGGQDILILVDGVRQSWTSGHDGRFFLDPALLSAVEVVRGPASALYGSGALGGVMSFRTATASDFLSGDETWGARTAFGFQGVNNEFLRTVTGFTHEGDFDFIGSIGERSSGDIKLGSGATLAADDDIVTGFAKAGYDFGSGLTASISYNGFQNKAVEPDDGQGLTSGAPVDKTIVSQQISGELNWKPVGSSFVDLHITPYHNDGSVREVDPATLENTLRDIKTDGISADNRTPFAFANVTGLVTIGGEWYQDHQVGRDSLGAGGVRSGVPNGEDSFWGAFAQIEANVDRPLGAPGTLSIIPAIRYNSFSTSSTGNPDTSRTSTSPKLAMTYKPVNWLFVFGNVGQAFRAPGVNELYLSGVHFSVPHPILGSSVSVANTFMPNPNLRPETSHYFEVGGGFVFHDVLTDKSTLQFKASYWGQRIDDYISLNVFTPPTFYSSGCFTGPTYLVDCNVGTTTSQNVDAQLSGGEFETSYDTDRFRLAINYGSIAGHQRGTSYDLPSLLPKTLTTIGTLKLPELDASLTARAQFAGGFHKSYDPASNDPSTEDRASYSIVDLYASWEPGDDVLNGKLRGLRIDAGVDNVGDENYTPFQAGVSAAGRNFKVLASYTLTR